MAQGRSNQAIAERLVITVRSVEKHVSSIFDNSACRLRATIIVACWPFSPNSARRSAAIELADIVGRAERLPETGACALVPRSG
jgi:FixJ family two-component response regulator